MKELEETFLEEYIGAQEQLEKQRYKNTLILLSKSLFALCDIVIYQKLHKLPKNHTERFRILEQYFPEMYPIIDNLFSHYTDAYNKPILKETCEEMNHGIKKIIKTAPTLPERIKKITK